MSDKEPSERCVVVESRGGVIVATYSNIDDLQIVVVDWDEVEAGGEAGKTVSVGSLGGYAG